MEAEPAATFPLTRSSIISPALILSLSSSNQALFLYISLLYHKLFHCQDCMCQVLIGKISFNEKQAISVQLSRSELLGRCSKAHRRAAVLVVLSFGSENVAGAPESAHATKCLRRLARRGYGTSRSCVLLVRGPCRLRRLAAYPFIHPSALAEQTNRQTDFQSH